MKKIIVLIVCLFIALSVISCEGKKEVNKVAIDYRYTPSRTEIVTDYQYAYSWWHGDFKLVPNTHSKTIPEKYEVLYFITYNDGTKAEQWQAVDYTTYTKLKGGE